MDHSASHLPSPHWGVSMKTVTVLAPSPSRNTASFGGEALAKIEAPTRLQFAPKLRSVYRCPQSSAPRTDAPPSVIITYRCPTKLSTICRYTQAEHPVPMLRRYWQPTLGSTQTSSATVGTVDTSRTQRSVKQWGCQGQESSSPGPAAWHNDVIDGVLVGSRAAEYWIMLAESSVPQCFQ